MESKADARAGDEETLIDTFCGITSASREEAAFFLESHNWTIDSALHSFYNNQDEIQDDDAGHFGLPSGPDLGHEAPGRSPPLPVPSLFSSSSVPVASAGKKPSSSKPSASGRQSGIRTLADLNRQPDPGSDSDSDGPQEYYTGGEKSGMLVQDPSKGTNDPDAIFDQARQMAAMQGTFEPNPPSSSRSFAGTGRLLSGETVPSTAPPENLTHNIYFWSNGFSVDDGPLRRFDDHENASFLESIRKSECPRELAPADRRSAVHVNLIRREENYPEPVERHSPFQGVGRTLGSGSSTASVVHETTAATVAPSAATAAVSSPSIGGPSVDDSLPSTSIQLRLADGTRMVARFNTSHTIGDIRAYINHHAAFTATASYTLQTVGFPPKLLSDETQTIEQAGLTNSVVIQKR